MTPTILERIARYARDEENKLRHDHGYYSPLVEIEITPDGLCVKSVAGDDAKTFQISRVLPWDQFSETAVTNMVNDISDGMSSAMSKETRI